MWIIYNSVDYTTLCYLSLCRFAAKNPFLVAKPNLPHWLVLIGVIAVTIIKQKRILVHPK